MTEDLDPRYAPEFQRGYTPPPPPPPPRAPADRPLLVFGALLVAAGVGAAWAGATTGTDFLTTQYEPHAELARATLRSLPGPLLAIGAFVSAVAAAPWLRSRPSGRPVLVGAAVVLLGLLGAALAVAADEVRRTELYWTSGEDLTIEQEVEMSRAGNRRDMLLGATPWILAGGLGLVALAVRGQRGQAGSASATASRDA